MKHYSKPRGVLPKHKAWNYRSWRKKQDFEEWKESVQREHAAEANKLGPFMLGSALLVLILYGLKLYGSS